MPHYISYNRNPHISALYITASLPSSRLTSSKSHTKKKVFFHSFYRITYRFCGSRSDLKMYAINTYRDIRRLFSLLSLESMELLQKKNNNNFTLNFKLILKKMYIFLACLVRQKVHLSTFFFL